MGKKIENFESWEMGQSYGMLKSIEKFVTLNFDLMKEEYIRKLRVINDFDLVDKMNDNILLTRIGRHNFELMLNLIDCQHQEQKSVIVVKLKQKIRIIKLISKIKEARELLWRK